MKYLSVEASQQVSGGDLGSFTFNGKKIPTFNLSKKCNDAITQAKNTSSNYYDDLSANQLREILPFCTDRDVALIALELAISELF